MVDVVELVEGSLLSVAGDGQVGSLGHPLSDSLIVKVADPSGDGLPGVTVEWSVGVRVATVTDSDGLAKVLWTLAQFTVGPQTATRQVATASASVSGVSSLSFTATTPSLVPLTDMGASTYFGFSGGLYPGGNVMPQAHADARQAFAAAVEPLDRNGNPSPSGKYVLLAIGHSITAPIFCNIDPGHVCAPYSFIGQAMADPDVDRTNLAIVRVECCPRAEELENPDFSGYDRTRDRLSTLGLREQQVQVVWSQLYTSVTTLELPDPRARAYVLTRQAGTVVRAFRSLYPNLRLVFFTSRVYGGYSERPLDTGEPAGYENGFSVKWLIQAQIDQMASGGTIVDVRAGGRCPRLS